jgi:PHD-finger
VLVSSQSGTSRCCVGCYALTAVLHAFLIALECYSVFVVSNVMSLSHSCYAPLLCHMVHLHCNLCVHVHPTALLHYSQPDNQENDDSLCSVCQSGVAPDDNLVVICDGCQCPQHQICGGISHIPEGDWYCDSCVALSVRASLCTTVTASCRCCSTACVASVRQSTGISTVGNCSTAYACTELSFSLRVWGLALRRFAAT